MTHFKGWAINNPWAALFLACAIFWGVVLFTAIFSC